MAEDLLKTSIKNIGLALNDHQCEQFLIYEKMLVDWNEKMNLTGITDSLGIYDKHFADSLTCLLSDKIFEGAKIIDVGTGAGFPGMPLKIMLPSLDLTLLDSLNKRIVFLENVAHELSFDDIIYLHGRAEDYGKDENYREKYDIVVSRAVADLSVLLEYCSPFLKVNGYFIAQKGKKVYEELEHANSALTALNLIVEEIKHVKTSDETSEHTLLVIKKIDHTDSKYPRKAGKPLKKPL